MGERASLPNHSEPDYRLWTNDARTVLVRMWSTGQVEVALRDSPAHTWGPPVLVVEEAL